MRFVSGKRFVLVLAVTLAAAIVTGVAASATKTVVPKQLTGVWCRGCGFGGEGMLVGPGGKVRFGGIVPRGYHATFSRVTAHRLSISGIRPCSGTGRYRWAITNRPVEQGDDRLKFTKIHDACKPRVQFFAASWTR
jgi:hypothetical protein